MGYIRFHASCLASKFGFSDGDIVRDVIYDTIENENLSSSDFNNHDVLVSVVQKYLLPKLPEFIEIETFSSIHNPIRAVAGKSFEFCEKSNIYVDVLISNIASMIASK